MERVRRLIEYYGMQPHPEGGYYVRTYQSAGRIAAGNLPPGFRGPRPFSTAIYFLLEQGNFSAFHRIRSDECWHFYEGGPLLIHIIDPGGDCRTVKLGPAAEKEERYQFVVPAGCWFASEPAPGTHYSFTGCTVSPGFDFDDFELADAHTLAGQYPHHIALIRRLCR
ncbi:MAG: cupin domain-containing protein [Sphingobacteriales bacterium]|nr:cupin domain-containing protein [Sphingobacteriales bacterium]